jgi:hypothetical protein
MLSMPSKKRRKIRLSRSTRKVKKAREPSTYLLTSLAKQKTINRVGRHVGKISRVEYLLTVNKLGVVIAAKRDGYPPAGRLWPMTWRGIPSSFEKLHIDPAKVLPRISTLLDKLYGLDHKCKTYEELEKRYPMGDKVEVSRYRYVAMLYLLAVKSDDCIPIKDI